MLTQALIFFNFIIQIKSNNNKKVRQTRRTLIEFAILDKDDIDTYCLCLKSWPPGGNTVDPEKENKQYLDQLGAKKESNDELAKSIKVMFSIWQW